MRRFCDRVIVMREGGVVEEGKTREVLENPREEYTRKLINCLKELNP
ncbi:hypothetical protein HZB08_00615 [Candidatus Saganbacteria bacterium]|uniref:Oligopeptide/dipeptide ABC transporter C-terminal domain-containing protein n=1 Tax=Candidatus Saganbacteria bacterium TaxID=2575572 RepID=A0A9D6ULR6_UNCSA|nr:hypothetical protein [Candidatus Saganbacteria bacterium]